MLKFSQLLQYFLGRSELASKLLRNFKNLENP